MTRIPAGLTLLAAAASLLAGSLAAPASAQAVPPEVLAATESLTAEQRKSVSDYVAAQARRYESADPAGVVAMRNEICRMLRSNGTKEAFRREYGAEFTKAFRKFASGNDMLRATNAFVIARHAACSDTMSFLADNMDPATQPSPAMRTAASAQMPKLVQAAQPSGPQAASLGKRVSGFIAAETEWVVASHDVATIVEALRAKGIGPEQTEALATALAGTVNELTSQVLDKSRTPLVQALQRALIAVRSDLPDLPGAARSRMLAAIGPSIVRLAAMKEPPPGVDDPELRTAFQTTMATAELLNKLRGAKAK